MSAGATYRPKTPGLLLRLLEGHATICIKLSEGCTHVRTKRVLRQLSADLLIEAERQRAIMKLREAPLQRAMVAAE